MIRLLIADRQQMFRQGLRRLMDDHPELNVVAEADDETAAVVAIKAQSVEVVIVDLAIASNDVQRLVAALKSGRPAPRVLALCAHAHERCALQALHAGADGMITRENAAEELFGAVRRLAAGGRYVCPAVAERLALDLTAQSADAPGHTRLSEREYAVFQMLIAGRRGSEIAQSLSLSEKTVSTHKSHVLRKLNLGNVSELMRYAIRHQLVSP